MSNILETLKFVPETVTNPQPATNNVGFFDFYDSATDTEKRHFENKVADIESPSYQSSYKYNGGPGFFGKIGSGLKSSISQFWESPQLMSMGANMLTSFLPERITSNGIDNINGVLGMAESLPVVGKWATLAKLGINALDSLGGSTLDKLSSGQDVDDTLAHTGGGYGDFMADWDHAKQYSGKRAGLFSNKSKMNNSIYDANRQMSALQGIIGKKTTDDLLTVQMGDRWNQRTMNLLNGGFGNISFGQRGLKITRKNIATAKRVSSIVNRRASHPTNTSQFTEPPKNIEVPNSLYVSKPIAFEKEGGKMNVIPEGSLHARLHHMENAEGLTKKGIPVVSIAEGGELEQQAEIELNEIIFRLEVTQEIEKLMKDGSDNAAIECGKMLVKEIFENTDDRTGLIKQLEPEKKESTTEDIVKNHQVFQEGGQL